MYIFSPSTVIKSSEVNDNFANLANGIAILDGAIQPRHLSNIDGWIATGETWTWTGDTGVGGISGQNATYFGTIRITGDKTNKYSPGMKIDILQTTWKMGFITKVEYSAPNTTLTIFFGTAYALANAPITDSYYSTSKSPSGFPLDPNLWEVKVALTSDVIQNPGTANAWYNYCAIDVPIGLWNVDYKARLGMLSAGTHGSGATTLSTANNSESDPELTAGGGTYVYNNTQTKGGFTGSVRKAINLYVRTNYYLNWRAVGQSLSATGIYGSWEKTVIKFVCAYL